jgi:hypothetical protein
MEFGRRASRNFLEEMPGLGSEQELAGQKEGR